jgi:hypothetical protein
MLAQRIRKQEHCHSPKNVTTDDAFLYATNIHAEFGGELEAGTELLDDFRLGALSLGVENNSRPSYSFSAVFEDNQYLHLNSDSDKLLEYWVYNSIGQCLSKGHFRRNLRLNCSDYVSGQYLLHYSGMGQNGFCRISKL